MIGPQHVPHYYDNSFQLTKPWPASKTKMLIRLDFEENKIVDEEIILKDKIGRIRDLEIDKKGDIYLIVDQKNSALWKLTRE